jgi:HD domain-containing protein
MCARKHASARTARPLLALAEVALVHAKESGGNATFRYSAELDGGDAGNQPEDDHGLDRLRALARGLDAEDPGTEGHSERVSRVAEKLALNAISVGARLLALAEAWDAMTSSRVYGEALDTADALAECRRERGTQFAPEAVDALDRLWALGALTTADVGFVASD